ncbi:hypothetical protein [Niallia oryzisoli]|uniref:hypothetical protein n=1 Tax=Niallia oryzisoli TaxID=1737571 RepID=UPI003736C654
MGLFINHHDNHPSIYKNNDSPKEPNQEMVRCNSISVMLQEQQKVNRELRKSIEEMKPRYNKLQRTMMTQSNHIKKQIHDLKRSYYHHEDFEHEMIQSLQALNEKNGYLQESIDSGSQMNHSIREQMNSVLESDQEMAARLEKNEAAIQQLSLKVNEQLTLHKETTVKQEDFQRDVLKRLDKQEALTEKISRQLNHIRSIIFERTNYIASKLENGYKLTSSYVYKLMNGSEQPLEFTLLNDKKREKHKPID